MSRPKVIGDFHLMVKGLLRSGTIYILAFLSIYISGCSSRDVFGVLTEGNEPPFYLEVLSATPAPGEEFVAVSSDIVISLNDNVDTSTIVNSVLINGVTDPSAVVTFDDQLKVLTYNPSSDFTPSTVYTITLTTGLANLVGETLENNYSWSFTTGTATEPEIGVELSDPFILEFKTGGSYYYGNSIDGTNVSATFTIFNTGGGVLDSLDALISGTDAANFTVSSYPSATVSPGGNTSLTVTFLPGTVAGNKSATLSIPNNDSNENPFTINLTARTVLTPEPEIQFDMAGLVIKSNISVVDFGTLAIGDSKTISVTVRNIGSADLDVTSFVKGGKDPDLFTTNFTAQTGITPGSSYTFDVTFTTTEKVNALADISFTNNDADATPFIINLKGRSK